MSAVELLKELIVVSEKAANIARVCRQNDHLFGLLVEEKTGGEANVRFIQDFKTLADCLIQEMIKHDIGTKYPELKENIRGEESPRFTNKLGETVTIEVNDDRQATETMLECILNGDKEAAKLLTDQVHNEIVVDFQDLNIPDETIPIGTSWQDMGIWIDPIDATIEYIKAIPKQSKYSNIMASGLTCVTVLIGVYEANTGVPLIGIINQPFESKIYWGLAIDDLKYNNISPVENPDKKIALLSPSEQSKYLDFIKYKLNYDIVFSAGAGYKILKVITGEACLFLLSKGTTYKWDTCAPQAILRSMNGDLFHLQETLINKHLKKISYEDRRIVRNTGGLIAYRDVQQFEEFLKM